MAEYFVMRMKMGKLNYFTVIDRYPQFKDEIDAILVRDGYKVNEDGTISKIEP